jgi:hypothetical protein
VITEDTKRYYPNGNFLAHVLGNTNVDGDGRAGIELQYNDDLKGVPGRIMGEVDAYHRELPSSLSSYIPPQNGKDIVLTIDQSIQYFTEKAIEKGVVDYKAKQITAIIMNPKTGEIIAMANKPDYDPNEPVKGSVEVLDWWKQAKNVFKIGSTAVVEDVRTGKTFKIVRTMGSNHADCEAASKADADIIKSIWGGFSWDVRPVIVNVSGRRLAASMSSLPHAGVDSAPAFATVDNRSEGYGSGENLDVIKGNGMNGHFDVHFLNSTRHKDGQVDPRHQAAIKIAAKQ